MERKRIVPAGEDVASEMLLFDDFELDRGRFQLRRRGRAVPLERIPLELLLLLVERRGEVVSRQEILEQIWGKQVFIDTDSGINTAVRKARRALDDDVDAPRYLLAVPGKGYRFIGTLRENGATPRNQRVPIVGRGAELDILGTRLDEAAAGRAGFVMICGDPGIGKSRLVEELADRAVRSRFEVLIGHAVDPEESAPLLPFVEVLEEAVERAANLDDLREMLGAEGPELARIVPKIGRVLPDCAPQLSELPAAQSRRFLFKACRDFIARRARSRPILLILEDLHWGDESSFALLRYLIRRISNVPILVIGTYRDSEIDLTPGLKSTLEESVRSDNSQLIRLEGLALPAVGEMLSRLSGMSPPHQVTEEFFRETVGNPFFVGELFRHLEAENGLYDGANGFRSEFKLAGLDVPHSVKLLVSRRLTRLGAETQEVLALAAIAGRSFTLELIEAAAKTNRLYESIEMAERAGLLVSNPDGLGDRFSFSHELVRQAVISGLPVARRRQLHRVLGESCERVYSGMLEDHFADLANHYRRGGDTRKALEFLDKAAAQAIERTASTQALEFVNAAIELLDRVPDDVHRARLELSIQLSHCHALRAIRGISTEELRIPLDRVLATSTMLKDRAATIYALDSLRAFHQLKSEVRQAKEVAHRLLAVAAMSKNPVELARAHGAIAQTHLVSGEFEEARQRFEQATRCPDFDSFGEPSSAWWKTDVLLGLSWGLWLLGYPEQAERASKSSLDAAAPNLLAQAFALQGASWIQSCLGRGSEARKLAESAIAICNEHDFPLERARATMNLGRALLIEGDAAGGLASIRQGLADIEKTGAAKAGTHIAMAAECLLVLGEIEEGIQFVKTGLANARATNHRLSEPELLRLEGELWLARGSSQARRAEDAFLNAIELARAWNAKSFELRAATSLARLLEQTKRRKEARTNLEGILSWFTEGFDTADLKTARKLLESSE